MAYVMLSKAMTKTYIVTEILFGAIFVALVHALTPFAGLSGATMAFCLTYGLYWAIMYFSVWQRLAKITSTSSASSGCEDALDRQ